MSHGGPASDAAIAQRGGFLPLRAAGPTLASTTAGGAFRMGATMFLLSGCLVTDEITFPEEPQFPPTILDVPGTDTPIGGILWVDLKQVTNEWRLKVQVRDDNIDEVLEARYRVWVGGEPALPAWESAEIPPSGAAMRETYEVPVRFGYLRDDTCHRVELAVSGSFVRRTAPVYFDVLNGQGERDDDIARASWTILEGEGEAKTDDVQALLLLRSCETIEAFLQQPALEGEMP
jgi:hypothetical protein